MLLAACCVSLMLIAFCCRWYLLFARGWLSMSVLVPICCQLSTIAQDVRVLLVDVVLDIVVVASVAVTMVVVSDDALAVVFAVAAVAR